MKIKICALFVIWRYFGAFGSLSVILGLDPRVRNKKSLSSPAFGQLSRGPRIKPEDDTTSKKKNMITSFSQETGHSLVELAIVLVVMGVIGGFAVPVLRHQISASKTKATHAHQERIFKSLAHYVYMTKGLPCPADPQAVGSKRGVENCQKSVGIIPFRTLGVPESLAKDGYNHFMTYGVAPEYSKKLATNKKDLRPYCQVHSTSLKVLNAEGRSVSRPLKGQKGRPVAVILLSQGEAYRHPNTAKELQNMKADLKFYENSTPNRECHHTVKWMNGQDLLSHYADLSCAKTLSKYEKPLPSTIIRKTGKKPLEKLKREKGK